MRINPTYFFATLAALIICRRSKRSNAVSGISPRHWLYEIGLAQQAGIDFWDAYNPDDEDKLVMLANNIGVQLTSKDKQSGITLGKKYYNQLARKFKPLKDQIGTIKYPYKSVKIKNSRGEDAIEVLDRDERRDLPYAISYVEDNLANGLNDTGAYWATIAAIARGLKFVWQDKKYDGTVTAYGVESSLFGQGKHEGERKKYFNILASEAKGGVYPEKLAEEISLDTNVLGGVLEALRTVTTRKAAADICLEVYYQHFDEPDYPGNDDLPF